MATQRAPMLTDDHAAKALEFLAESDREFAEGDHLQASEKLWAAATHAVMAAAEKRGWPHDSSHRALHEAAERLSDDQRSLNCAGIRRCRKVSRQLSLRLHGGL